MERVGSSAFIFSGGNSSVLDRRFTPPMPYAVDLTSLPTTLTAQGAGLDLASNSLYAPLSSILVCDLCLQITGGQTSITSDGNLTLLSSGKAPIGNIIQSATNFIFMNALGIALVEIDTLTTANVVNSIAPPIGTLGKTEVRSRDTLHYELTATFYPASDHELANNEKSYMSKVSRRSRLVTAVYPVVINTSDLLLIFTLVVGTTLRQAMIETRRFWCDGNGFCVL
jgi:hypothetical protein